MTETTKATQIILFTSCKGGVGKSTVCANLAMSMATLGKKVLMIDCDFGNRCLDIVTGLANETIYDIGDVLMHRVPPERAIVVDRRNPNLHFIAAPYDFNFRISPATFRATVKFYAESGEYDFLFLDTPGGVGEPLMFAANVADSAYIIVAPTKAAIRAADRTASFLYGRGVKRQLLIVNRIAGRKSRRAEDAKDELLSIIDESRIKLLGAVPYDPELISAGDKGILTDEILSEPVTRAFDNIAKRILGVNVPLFYKIKKIKRIR